MPDPQMTQELMGVLQRMIAFYRGMGPACDDRSAYQDVPALGIDDLVKGNPGAVVLDVRTADEFVEGHIAGSKNISFDQIPVRYGDLPPKDTLLIVTCQQGVRSRIACNMLAHLGYSKLYNVLEGMNGWAGPVDTGEGGKSG